MYFCFRSPQVVFNKRSDQKHGYSFFSYDECVRAFPLPFHPVKNGSCLQRVALSKIAASFDYDDTPSLRPHSQFGQFSGGCRGSVAASLLLLALFLRVSSIVGVVPSLPMYRNVGVFVKDM